MSNWLGILCRLTLAVSMILVMGSGGSHAVAADAARVDFMRDIRPILSDNCYFCHGPDENTREADLRLDVREAALADLGGYAAIVPGDIEKSDLVARLVTDDEDELMPPAESGKHLTEEQIELVKQWIAEGADWPEHWSFVPPKHQQPPQVDSENKVNNDIDRFVLVELKSRGLSATEEADRRTLIRRLTFDLTGLPPTLAEVHAFLADKSEGAYQRVVDRLLASPHFGERMTVAWLDQARYADTNGYSIDGGRHMWLWRDWVIDAYNQNMPFDQFTTEQLAGDLLPEATESQLVATGFNRNHMITHEGGTIPAENLVNYTVDRVKTTSEVFLGLTMGCAQCHDHKYDPLTQTDFYRFFAFFNTLEDRGLDGNAGINAGPKVEVSTFLGKNRRRQIEQRLAELEEMVNSPLESQPAWEAATKRELAERGKDLKLHPLKILKLTTPNRGLEKQTDEWIINSLTQKPRSPSVVLEANVDEITGLRVEFLPHESLPKGGLGHGKGRDMDGSLLLTSFSVSADAIPSDQVDLYKMVPIREATASAANESFPPADCLDPRGHNGWSPHPENQTPQHITFTFEQPIQGSDTPYITAMLVWGGGSDLIGGQYRFFALTGNDDGTNLPEEIQNILTASEEERSDQQRQQLQEYYATVAPELKNAQFEIENLKEQLKLLSKPQPVMVMNVSKEPRETFMLNRGQYDQPGEKVTPGVPECLPPMPEEASADRLGLAEWLTDPGHPLTARVAVNRLWQLLFGAGLVSSSADFGSQGQSPSHPELLDYLAVDFVESGWDVKRMIKLMVMSATYQQSSRVTPELLEKDPNNVLLARGPRFRLQAEFIRDTALNVSGLLVDRIGGPSVKPYQPAGLWREVSHYGSSPATAQVFVQDHGEKLYRRSMYTYWKRTVPPPSMVSLDAPNRELCVMRRASTNTPLQALVLLNDPQFVEASRAMAERIILEGPQSDADRIRFAFELATARLPSEREVEILQGALRRSLKDFQQNPERAKQYLLVGESNRNESIDLAEHAAWASVASMILNLSETITKG